MSWMCSPVSLFVCDHVSSWRGKFARELGNSNIERFKHDTSTLSAKLYSSGLGSPLPYADTGIAASSSETPIENGRKCMAVQERFATE